MGKTPLYIKFFAIIGAGVSFLSVGGSLGLWHFILKVVPIHG